MSEFLKSATGELCNKGMGNDPDRDDIVLSIQFSTPHLFLSPNIQIGPSGSYAEPLHHMVAARGQLLLYMLNFIDSGMLVQILQGICGPPGPRAQNYLLRTTPIAVSVVLSPPLLRLRILAMNVDERAHEGPGRGRVAIPV